VTLKLPNDCVKGQTKTEEKVKITVIRVAGVYCDTPLKQSQLNLYQLEMYPIIAVYFTASSFMGNKVSYFCHFDF
jgi:hypothetical protein